MRTENIDGVIKNIDTEQEFIEYVGLVWEENELENGDCDIEKPFDLQSALSYIILYTEIKILW